MTEQPTFAEAAAAMRERLNTQDGAALLRMAHNLLGATGTTAATVTDIDADGLGLRLTDAAGAVMTGRIPFDGVAHVAAARVPTDKASRYLKALCNHFDRKAEATHDDNSGRIRFAFGECELTAEDGTLALRVSADRDSRLQRVCDVVAGHLVRFAIKEELRVEWVVVEMVG